MTAQAQPKILKELIFADGMSRARLSGCKSHTIREGRRTYHQHISVRGIKDSFGYAAKVESCKYYTFAFVPFEVLLNTGFKSLGHLMIHMQKFYPGLKYHSVVTVVEFTAEIPLRKADV